GRRPRATAALRARTISRSSDGTRTVLRNAVFRSFGPLFGTGNCSPAQIVVTRPGAASQVQVLYWQVPEKASSAQRDGTPELSPPYRAAKTRDYFISRIERLWYSMNGWRTITTAVQVATFCIRGLSD